MLVEERRNKNVTLGPSMQYFSEVDISFYRALNAFCGWSPTLDRAALHVPGVVGVLFMGIFGLLWFRPDTDQFRRREMLVMIFPAVALGLILNRTISTLLPFRVRPMYAIGANAPSHSWTFDLENWSSFPSDNATYLFAITACLWALLRPFGIVFGLFSTCVLLARIYFGIHYPSDIVVGALLGIAVAVALNVRAVRDTIAKPLLVVEKQMPSYFYGLLFMGLAEVAGVFSNTRHVGMAIVHVVRGYDG
jgi:undecaprenyl-diphosphatase